MSFLDKLLKRSLKPSEQRRLVRETPGPLTAHEAWAYAKVEALALDGRAQLVLVTSGTDIRTDGKSFAWEFLFDLPGHNASILLSYGPPENCQDVDSAPVLVVMRVSMTSRPPQRVLPFDFRNSPQVVDELSRMGVDFVAGQTDMKLEGKCSAEGEPQWITYSWGKQIAVPFSVMSAG
ncbi:hypothetical protein KBY96_05580 [Cyanobium sp. ATX 6A2]|uniref:hypothetical protein n=1 Tax=Cyanobium sp. ATX 6A2 TaxID=2823700 RepID=UPI0020CD637B|nr:hypothetical protein [Cyanobium sp. ATX 6A2]MCP9887407.1 hypothetical protein [Cyanobium sp. ATX 6A2]